MMKTLRKNLLFVLLLVLFVSMAAFVMRAPTANAQDESVFKMDYGVYVRLKTDDDGYGGLRFRVKFTDDVKERVAAEDVTMGFTVMTKDNYDAIADKANYEYATATGEGIWQMPVDEEKIYSAKDQITEDIYNYANLLIKLSSNFETEYAVIANIAQNGVYEYAEFEEGSNVKSLYYAVNRVALDVFFEDVVRTYDWYGKDYNAYPVQIDSTNYEALVDYKDDVANAGLKTVFESDVEDTENIKAELDAKYRYTVNFVNYDGQTSSATVLEGDTIVAPSTPTLGSLTFDGWVNRDGSAMPANAVANATYYTSWKISSASDFAAVLVAANESKGKAGGFTGYYTLTQDVDLVDTSLTYTLGNSQDFTKGWQATFDGNGYALKNVKLGWQGSSSGLFGEIGTNGVIKNVTITPLYDGTNTFKGYGGLVANNSAGLVENVYVKVASVQDNAANACLVRYCVKSAIIRNCVVEYAGGNLANSALFVKINGGAKISNCYAVTTATFPDSANCTKKDSVISLYNTENNGLAMLTYDGTDIKWGNVKVVEKITLISSEQDFADMLAAANTAKAQEGGFTGYYVLTKNLDLKDTSLTYMLSNTQNFEKGWQATFDGNGYALQNVKLGWQTTGCGLFGEIGTNGVVKNVTIIPAYSGANTFKGYGGVVANNSAGLVENVYVKVASVQDNAANACLVRYCVKGSIIRNCVVEYTGGNLANAALFVKTNGGTISNCYAVTAATFPDSTNATKIDSVNTLYNTVTGLKMLSLNGNDIMWGNFKIATISA